MEDLISRKAAIDAVISLCDNCNPGNCGACLVNFPGMRDCKKVLEELPSAQPETHEERTETHACDYINRKDAIDALFKLYEYQRDIDPTEAADLVRQGVYLAEKKIEQLPSAQLEMIREIRKWINSSNRGNADYFIVDKIEEIINKYE